MKKVSSNRKSGWVLILYTLYLISSTALAHAAAPALKLTPLKYQEIIPADRAKIGFIDVANPTDSSVRIVSEVQAFRQINLEGDLEFYNNDQINKSIKVASTDFELGPREAVRVAFTVDAPNLHKGGLYAAVFFRTVPPEEKADVTRIATSAKVGTLLILDIGGEVKPEGKIKAINIPFWNFGRGFAGSVNYLNTASSIDAIAFNPTLSLKAGPWGKTSKVDGPLILPGNTRNINFNKPGNYLGLVPLVLSDSMSRQSHTVWVFAVTGFWRVVLLVLMALVGIRLALRRKASLKKSIHKVHSLS